MLLGRALHAATSGHTSNRHANKPDVPMPCAHPTVCQASQGWYSGAVHSQSKHSAGPLKAPTDTRQRRQEQERRESGSQASSSQNQKHRFEFDQSSQLGHNSSSQLGGSSNRPTNRGVPVAWAFDPRDLELLDPDQQYKRSDSSQESGSSYRSHAQVVPLAGKIFNRLLQVSDLSSDEVLAQLAGDIISYLPSPSASPEVAAPRSPGMDSQMEQIIAQSSGGSGVQEAQLSQQDLAELMLELRKLGGTRVALAVCDMIDGCGKGYATRSTEVFNAMLCQCDPKTDQGVVQDVFDRMNALGLPRDVATFNSGMLAYAKVAMFDEVAQVAAEMNQQGVQPDSLSYRIRIYTASKMQAWPRALQLYREMEATGVHRDEYVYHHLLEALRLGHQPDLMMQCTDWLRADNIPCGPHLYIPLMKCCVDSGRQDVKLNFVAVMKDLLGPMPTWIMQPFIAHCINHNTPQTGLALLRPFLVHCSNHNILQTGHALLRDLQEAGLEGLLGTGAAVPGWAREKLKSMYRGLAIMTNMAGDPDAAWILDTAERHVPDGYMYKTTMQALAEAGQFEEAFNIMNRMYAITKREDIHQFGESQLAYVAGNMGRMDIAWRILDVCQQHQAKPSVVTINAIMGAVFRSQTMPDSDKMTAALKLVDKIHQHGMQVDEATCYNFLGICGLAKDAANAEKAWEWCQAIPGAPSLHMYNVMIDTLEKSAQYDKAVQLFEKMRGQGIQGDMKTYGAMVEVFAARGDWSKQKTALKVQEWMEGQGTRAGALTYPELIAKAKDGGNWRKALQLWDEAQAQQAAQQQAAIQPTDKTYAIVIKACGKLGLWEKALELKNQFTDRRPTRYVYNNLLMTLNVCNQLAPALEVKAEMEEYGIGLDGFSYFTLLLNICNNAEDWKMALRLFGEMRRKGHYANISCYTTLLQCLADHGQASHALQIFRFMTTNTTTPLRPSFTCYEHVIRVLAADGQWSAAVSVYNHERRLFTQARFFYYEGISNVSNELRLPGLSTAMASTVMRGYLLALSTQGAEQWTMSDNTQPMKDEDNFVITVGSSQGVFAAAQMVRCHIKPAGIEELVRLVEDFLTVPGAEVKYFRRLTKTGETEFFISKTDMMAWLQSVDILAPQHLPLS